MTDKEKEYQRQYQLANKDKLKEYHRQWYLAHKEEQARKGKEYYEANKEHHYEVCRKYAVEHPDLIKEHHKKWARKHLHNYLDLTMFKWEDVEGYDGWTVNTEVHHRLEMFGFTRDELIAQDRYYNCTPDELLCLSNAEHARLHAHLRRVHKNKLL